VTLGIVVCCPLLAYASSLVTVKASTVRRVFFVDAYSIRVVVWGYSKIRLKWIEVSFRVE
jgi:hypothetical protein